MIEYQEHDRERAVRDVARAIVNPLVLMSVPDRNCAYALCDFHKVTGEDLLTLAVNCARGA